MGHGRPLRRRLARARESNLAVLPKQTRALSFHARAHSLMPRPKDQNSAHREGQGAARAQPAPGIGRRVLGKRPFRSPPDSQYGRRAPRAGGGPGLCLGAALRARAPYWHCDGHLPHVFAQKPLGKSTDACRIQPTSHLPNAFCWSQV